jgi:hypothetical protein
MKAQIYDQIPLLRHGAANEHEDVITEEFTHSGRLPMLRDPRKWYCFAVLFSSKLTF